MHKDVRSGRARLAGWCLGCPRGACDRAADDGRVDHQANNGISGETKNVHSDIENLVTGEDNDKITGSTAANRLDGGKGNDVIDPLAG